MSSGPPLGSPPPPPPPLLNVKLEAPESFSASTEEQAVEMDDLRTQMNSPSSPATVAAQQPSLLLRLKRKKPSDVSGSKEGEGGEEYSSSATSGGSRKLETGKMAKIVIKDEQEGSNSRHKENERERTGSQV
jgi:hypothetical protein